jgi:predicted GIY-YIG superfamily endonuclease
MCLKKGKNSLNNIQKHFMYNITCENNNKVYIGQNIDPYKQFKQHMCRARKKMKHDIDISKTINLTFKLIILYSNMHKYKADRMENLYIQYFDSTSKIGYNNLKGKPTSFKKY